MQSAPCSAPRRPRTSPRGGTASGSRTSPDVTYVTYTEYSEVVYGRVPSVLHRLLEGVASWALGAVVTVASAPHDRPHMRYAAAPLSPPEEVTPLV